ncbi:MAG: NAD(P)/FAD-dependent oxidoreductase [Planctomycetota bacterium]|jgi:sarcosine oxidase subunit beta
MKRSAEVVIIGGGVIGCAIAYNLAKERVNVVVLERDYLASGASGRCGAMIWAKWYPMETSELMARVGNMTLKRFANLEEELETSIEYNIESTIACVKAGEEDDYDSEIQELEKYFDTRPEFLKPEEIKKMAPYIGVDNYESFGGYLHSGTIANASANPFLTVHELANAARRLGATVYTGTEVKDIIVENGKVEGVRTDKGDIKTNIVVDAAGAWSADVARMAGLKIPTRPHGEDAVVTEPLMPLPYFPEIPPAYGRQTKSGQILIGENDFPEQASSYSTETTLDFLPRITEHLLQMFPSFGNINIVRHWAGTEDITPDELPILGKVDELEGLILACGFTAGFCISQAVGELVADIILEKDKNQDIAKALSLNRFEKKYREYPGRWYYMGVYKTINAF